MKNSNYILTVVDNYSRYLAGFPLVKKEGTTDVLISLLENEEKRLGYYPSLICSNGGGEFTENRLVRYLDEKHIQRLTSEPYHPEHNGRAECANLTILESMRATFKSSCVAKNYWHKVVKSCCFYLNQIPKQNQDKFPWNIVHGHAIPQNYLKPFGTPAVILKMKRVKGWKFDKKGEEGVLLGFNVPLSSYCILVKSRIVIETKHVRFLKSSPNLLPDGDNDFYPEMKTVEPERPEKLAEQEPPANSMHLSQEENDYGDSEDLQSVTMAEEEIQDILLPPQQDPQEPQSQPPTCAL
jgi:hypothetical protein